MNVEGDGIYYELIGNHESRQNLVFVHGSGCNRKFLGALAKKLKQFNCYMIDLPDHGKSTNRKCTKVEDYIDAVSEFVSKLEHVTIIGHSLGGTICLGVAAKSIPSVERSVIISSGAKFSKLDPKIHTMVKKQKVNWGYLVKCLGSWWNLSVLRDYMNFESSDIILKDFAIDIELNVESILGNIKKPVLIMVGKNDILTLPEYSVKLNKAIKKSKLIVVPGCRHMLPIAKKEIVAKLIAEFIDKK